MEGSCTTRLLAIIVLCTCAADMQSIRWVCTGSQAAARLPEKSRRDVCPLRSGGENRAKGGGQRVNVCRVIEVAGANAHGPAAFERAQHSVAPRRAVQSGSHRDSGCAQAGLDGLWWDPIAGKRDDPGADRIPRCVE